MAGSNCIRLLYWNEFKALPLQKQKAYVRQCRRAKMMEKEIVQNFGVSRQTFDRWKKKNNMLILQQVTYKKKEEPSICFDCANACGGCTWSRCLEPVEGWEAVISPKPSSRGRYAHIPDYKVVKCPEFKPDKRESKIAQYIVPNKSAKTQKSSNFDRLSPEKVI